MKNAGLLVAFVLTMACSTSSQPASTAAKSPPARGYHNLIGLGPDPGVFLYAGETSPPRAPASHVFGDAWLWRSGHGWTEKSGIGTKDGFAFYEPKVRRVFALVFDTEHFAPLVENWTYDPGSDSWTQRDTDKRPDLANGSTGAFDSESGRLIVFGGETWAYDPEANTWAKMAAEHQPDFGPFPVIVYAEQQDRLVLLGGYGREDLTDVWVYDFNHDAWTEKHAASGPTARTYPAAAYDARADRVILFGGLGDRGPLSDTWSYDVKTNAWSDLKPQRSPSARARHAMAYDSETGKVVMFGGGDDPFHFRNDTWIYDPSTNNWSAA